MSSMNARPDIDITIPSDKGTPPPDYLLGWIDDYELVRELGSGGYGSVYLVRDKNSGSEYAVKGLPPDVRQNPRTLERLLSNFRSVEKLSDKHIASMLPIHIARNVKYFHQADKEKLRVEPGDPLVVMKYAPGLTLSEWRKKQPYGKVPNAKAAGIVAQIASALDYAHGRRVLHRDIKPSNVVIDEHIEYFDCQVLDFGIAAEIPPSVWHSQDEEIRDAGGTPRYMAPEQWCQDPQGPATDQYALAVLYCELVTGKVPFQGAFDTGDAEVMKSAVISDRPDLSEIPRTARRAVARALAKKHDSRFPSCVEFADALVRSPWPRRFLGIGIFAVIAGTVTCFLLWPAKQRVLPVSVDKPTILPNLTFPEHIHRFGNWTTNVQVGCETQGVRTRNCVASGCSNPSVAESETLPSFGEHKWGDWEVVVAPRVGVAGQKMRFCLRCGRKEHEEVPSCPHPLPHVHTYGEWNTVVQPGCTTVGKQERFCTASGCSEPKASEIRTLDALGHDWCPWSVTSAKVGVAGERRRQCRRCQEEEKNVIPPLLPDQTSLLGVAQRFADEARKVKGVKKQECWQKCYDAAVKVLGLAPGNKEARRLKAQAENGLSTLDSPKIATPQNTDRGKQDANGVEWFNNR